MTSFRSSSSGEVERLLDRLASDHAAERDAAVARLRVIGSRAVERLATLARHADAPAPVRAAALRALEGTSDRRAIAAAMALLEDDEDVATAAVAVLRAQVNEVTVLEALTSVALDSARAAAVRLAAVDALSQLPRTVVQPLLQQVAVDGDVPDDPLAAREWLERHPRASLSTLHDFIAIARDLERREPSARRRQDWLVTRGAAHAVVARRGSRVALYDLRATFDAADAPLPLDFLTAIAAIGGADCLEPMARAWTAAPEEKWWRDRLAEAAAEIMKREKLTSRSAVVKRVRAKYQGFVQTQRHREKEET